MRKTLTQALLAAFCAILARGTSAAHVEGGGVMLVNLRNGMMGGKRTPTAKDYPAFPDLLYWDGIENAGFGLHSSSPQYIADLSGNGYNGTVTLGTIEDNAVYLNGLDAQISNDSASKVKNAIENCEITIEVVAQQMQWDDVDRRAALFTNVKTTGLSGVKAYFIHNTWPRWFLWLGTYRDVSAAALKQGEINTIALQGSSDGYSAYLDGVLKTSRTVTGTQYPATDYIAVGGVGQQSQVQDMRVYAFRIHSRILTASEIAANYAIDKARFNLP